MPGEREQIFVPGDGQVGMGAFRACENHVVGGVAAEMHGAAQGDADGLSKNWLERFFCLSYGPVEFSTSIRNTSFRISELAATRSCFVALASASTGELIREPN